MSTRSHNHLIDTDAPASRARRFARGILEVVKPRPAFTPIEMAEQIPKDLPPYRQLAQAATLHDRISSTADQDVSAIHPIIDSLSERTSADFKEWQREMELKPHQRSKEKENGLGLSINEVVGCIHAWEVHPSPETKQAAFQAISMGAGEWSGRYKLAFALLLAEKTSNPESTMQFYDALDKTNRDALTEESDISRADVYVR